MQGTPVHLVQVLLQEVKVLPSNNVLFVVVTELDNGGATHGDVLVDQFRLDHMGRGIYEQLQNDR